MKRLTRQDLARYRRGANIVARGSGSATPFMDNARDDELPSLIDPADVGGHFATVVKFGATGTVRDWGEQCVAALRALCEDADVSLSSLRAIAPGEINRSQFDRALQCCSAMGLPIVDGDHVGGTAVPSIGLCRSLVRGIGLRVSWRAVDASSGALRVLAHGVDDFGVGPSGARDMDSTLRARTGAGGVAAALFLTRDPEVVLRGTVSSTIALGAALEREDPIGAILERTGGERLGSGALREIRRLPATGFSACTVAIGELRVGVLNEFATVTRDGVELCRAPDLIAIVDHRGDGVLTAELERHVGHELHVLRLPLPERIAPELVEEWERLIRIYEELALGRAA